MSAINDVMNYFQSLYQSGDIKLVVDIALIVMLTVEPDWILSESISNLHQ